VPSEGYPALPVWNISPAGDCLLSYFPEKRPVFHARLYVKDEYNQSRSGDGVSGLRHGVVSCGQRTV
jgi:hypothetical protein